MLSFLLLQHTNDFALYTEAIKFFNHPESMVRIAVRTITLNVYKGMVSILTKGMCTKNLFHCSLSSLSLREFSLCYEIENIAG